MNKSHLQPIAYNAMRLYEDAKLLFDAGRFPSSLSLSVLSLEETGKFYMLKHDLEEGTVIKNINTTLHVQKQIEASWFCVETMLLHFFDVLDALGYEHKPYSEASNLQRKWLGTAAGIEFTARLHRGDYPPGVLEATEERTKSDGTIRDYQEVSVGELDRLKQAGFYVDLEDDLTVKSIPQKIGKERANKWLERAKTMADRVLQDARDELPSGPYVTVLKDALIEKGQ